MMAMKFTSRERKSREDSLRLHEMTASQFLHKQTGSDRDFVDLQNKFENSYKILGLGAREIAQWLRALRLKACNFSIEPRFSSQHLHNRSQPQLQRPLHPLLASRVPDMHMMQADIHIKSDLQKHS